MRATIGVYDSHEKAAAAVSSLKEAGYPIKQLSVMGQAGLSEYDMHHVNTREVLVNAPIATGVVVGPILGILAGVGVFAIPGLGLLFGAGAVVGAIAGLDLGLVAGGLATVFTRMGMSAEKAEIYETHLKDGKFLVLMEGTEEEVMKAQGILAGHGTHHELDVH